MRRATVTITLPALVVQALDGECRRLLVTRSVVVEQVLRDELPQRLARDLRPVLDVPGEEVDVAEIASGPTP